MGDMHELLHTREYGVKESWKQNLAFDSWDGGKGKGKGKGNHDQGRQR